MLHSSGDKQCKLGANKFWGSRMGKKVKSSENAATWEWRSNKKRAQHPMQCEKRGECCSRQERSRDVVGKSKLADFHHASRREGKRRVGDSHCGGSAGGRAGLVGWRVVSAALQMDDGRGTCVQTFRRSAQFRDRGRSCCCQACVEELRQDLCQRLGRRSGWVSVRLWLCHRRRSIVDCKCTHPLTPLSVCLSVCVYICVSVESEFGLVARISFLGFCPIAVELEQDSLHPSQPPPKLLKNPLQETLMHTQACLWYISALQQHALDTSSSSSIPMCSNVEVEVRILESFPQQRDNLAVGMEPLGVHTYWRNFLCKYEASRMVIDGTCSRRQWGVGGTNSW